MEQLIPVGPDHLWVEDSGGDGPAVLLLHPGIADSRAWEPIWPGLRATCRGIRFDVRAYGRSPAATQKYTVVDDALAVLDHLEVERAHLVGCSMGGAAAIDLTVLHPARVQSLTLLCPGVNGYPWPDEPEIEAEYERLVEADDQEGLLQFGLREWAASGHEPIVVELMRSAGDAQSNESAFQESKAPTYDRLHEIATKAVLIVGDRDRASMIAADEAAAARIPGCRLISMPGVDHLPMLREPDWVLRTILEQVSS